MTKCFFLPLKLPCWLAVFLQAWLLAVLGADLACANSIQKIICSYALTSANDFPQRDPHDWRLLGSNDGGKTWVLLDRQTNQIFASRQERLLYKIPNRMPFAVYRLEIDQVRQPVTAGSVQLAELELMGATEEDRDPTPTLADKVSAQGDNPPGETVRNLFDGRVQTKWLDWASGDQFQTSWVQWEYVSPKEMMVTNINQLLELRSRAADGIPIRIRAVVVGIIRNQTCLVDTTGCILLDLQTLIGGNLATTMAAHHLLNKLVPGQSIWMTGVSAWTGKRVGVKPANIHLGAETPPSEPWRISPEQPLATDENLKWVQMEGNMQYPYYANQQVSFDLQEGSSVIRVHLPVQGDFSAPPLGTRVLVRGICLGAFDPWGHWVASELWAIQTQIAEVARPGEAGPPHDPSPANPVNPAVLTSIQQVRRLSPKELDSHPRVKIRGVITDELQGFVQDGTAGIEVTFSYPAKLKIHGFGRYIEISGWAKLDAVGSPEIWAESVAILGAGKLPQPQILPPGQFANAQIDAQWVEVDGVVHSTDGSHLLITSLGQELTASVTEAPVESVNRLVDAEVRVRGVAVMARDNHARVQGIHLLIPSLDYVDIVAPPANPAMLPARKIGSLLYLSGPGEPSHLVKIEGVVTLQQWRRVFLHDDTGNSEVILKGNVVLDARFGRSHWLYWQTATSGNSADAPVVVNPGDVVQVTGFLEPHRYSLMMTEATITRLKVRKIPWAVPLTTEGLTEGELDSSLVQFAGILRGQTAIGGNVVLDLEWKDRTLQVLVPRKPDHGLDIETGSRVHVTGVCQIDPPSYPELGLVAGPVHILSRSSSDLTIISRPPWWTVGRALALLGGMTLATLATLVWIRELHRQVGERSAELAEEVRLREKAESRHALEVERARIAKDLHDDLGANLTQIIFLSERVEGARHDEHDVDGWFARIPATARQTIQSLDEIVWAINPRHDSLESLANYLTQFAQQHLALAHVRCILDVPTVLPSVPLSAEVRHNLLLTTREALQNAVIHAGASEVSLSLRLDKGELCIAISDNGKGFDPSGASPHSNGLENIRDRLEAIGARLEIRSAPGAGATLSFFVPKCVLPGRAIGPDQHFG